MIKSPRATIDFSPVSITRATHGGQTRVVRISGSRRAVDAWLSLSCGPDYEYRLWKREEKGGREREREREGNLSNGVTDSPWRMSPIHVREFKRFYSIPSVARPNEDVRGINPAIFPPSLSDFPPKTRPTSASRYGICFDHFPRFSGNLRVWPRRVYPS